MLVLLGFIFLSGYLKYTISKTGMQDFHHLFHFYKIRLCFGSIVFLQLDNKPKMSEPKLSKEYLWNYGGFFLLIMLAVFACQSGTVTDKKLQAIPSHIRFEEGQYVFFTYDSDSVLTSPKFYLYRDSLMRVARTGLMTVVTGLYESREQYSGPYENLGMARAQAIKKLLAKQIPASRISCMSEMTQLPATTTKGLYEAYRISFQPLKENL
ncbi:MAG TPA: hypothetical protein PLN76_07970 [Saprospiraceae bacterium]|nr:hypothetical protein [Saprospiraceae bacterium]